MSEAVPAIHVRAAARRDIPAIVAAGTTSVSEDAIAGFGTPRSTQPFADVARLSAVWEDPNRVGSEEVLVAEFEGRVVGYATVENRGRVLELVDLEIAREHQRRGIGHRMVAFIEERGREEGKDAVTLGTSRNAAGVPWPSFPWWRGLGYHVTHEEENDWTRRIGPGTREIRMRKDLRSVGRVELGPIREPDLEAFFEMQQDPVAGRMAAFTAKDPSDREAFRTHWARVLADERVTMRTVLVDGQVAGNVGSFFDPDLQRTEVTYWIARAHWGRGIATRALRELLRVVGTRPMYARAAADNVASIRVLEKCGFVRVDAGRDFANARGEETDEVVLRLDAGPPPEPAREPEAPEDRAGPDRVRNP